MKPPRTILTHAIALTLATHLPAQTLSPRQQLSRSAADSLGSGMLSEVVVTAREDRSYFAPTAPTSTRLAEPILDTPRSVQVVTRQIIEDRAINDPQEAVQSFGGAVRSASFTGTGENFLVRGFQQQDLLKDGFRAGANSNTGLVATGPTDIANIERIELLKGPSAILYGRGEPGGVVSYITRTPAFENRFSLEQQVGSYDFHRTELAANWNAVPGKVALRLDAAYDRSESFIDFVESERYFAAPSFLWKIGPDTTLTFRGEYTHDQRSSNPGVPYVNGEVLPGVAYHRYYGEPGFTEFTNETWRGLLELEHRWSENARTKLSLHGRHAESEGPYFILFNFAGPSVDPLTGDISRGVAITDFTDENVTIRLDQSFDWTIYGGGGSNVTDKDGKTASSTGGFTIKNQLLLSAEFERETRDTSRLLGAQAPINAFNPRYSGYAPLPLLPFPGFPLRFNEKSDVEANAYSLLLLDRLSFGETVYLSLGGRVEWFDAAQDFTYPATVPFPSSTNNQDEVTFNPSVGLVVKPARNVSLYASYAESSSSFQNIGRVTANGDALDPERAHQYEIGVKAELFDQRLIASAAAFQIEKTDVAGTDPANPLFSINAGEERSRGFELSLAGEPLPGWRILANYAYVDARVTDDPLNVNTGHRRFGVPENSGGLFTTYEIQDGPLKGLGFGGGAYFSDRVETSNANTGKLSGWVTADAVLYYRRDGFRVQLNVKNLTDEEYYYTYNVSGDGATVLPGNARTVVLSAKFEF